MAKFFRRKVYFMRCSKRLLWDPILQSSGPDSDQENCIRGRGPVSDSWVRHCRQWPVASGKVASSCVESGAGRMRTVESRRSDHHHHHHHHDHLTVSNCVVMSPERNAAVRMITVHCGNVTEELRKRLNVVQCTSEAVRFIHYPGLWVDIVLQTCYIIRLISVY